MTPVNASDIYFGTYVRFNTANKNEGAALMGPDNAVGDRGEIGWTTDDAKRQRACLVNRFGHTIGFLDESISYKLAVLRAKEWIIRYVFSFAALSEDSEEGQYWGQVAIIAFAPRYKNEFEEFLAVFAQKAGEGLRPNPELSTSDVNAILAQPSSWKSSVRVPIPQNSASTVILKDHRTMREKVIEQGRKKNPGCYLVSWLFIIALVAFFGWLLHFMGIF